MTSISNTYNVIVLDKERTASRKGILMINASKGFIKDGNKNCLRSQDIHKIVNIFNKRLESKGFSYLVPVSEISDPKNGYNLNLPGYIDSSNEADIHNLTGHSKGGIPKRVILMSFSVTRMYLQQPAKHSSNKMAVQIISLPACQVIKLNLLYWI